ncbi:hypothetical protein NHJ6243_009617 [Beauveria neobassiana]
MATEGIITYNGNCHCGRYRFEIDAQEITGAITCDCAMCAKKGYLWIIPEKSAFRVIRDDNCLTEFQSTSLRDKFCNYCGTGLIGEHTRGPMSGKFAVNIRAIRNVNPFKLEPNLVMKPTNEQKRDFDSLAKLHMSEPRGQETASCYCGKVRAELLFPLSEQEMKEDNCSSCVRTAYIGVYPTRDQVRILGRKDTFEYIHGKRYSGVSHCKDCGVYVFKNIYGPDPSVFDKLAPERRAVVLEIYHKNMALQPVNVRTIEGLDLKSIKVERSDSGTDGYVLDD